MTDDAPARPDIPDELGGNPLTDEDVRRKEHPEEFETTDDPEPATAAPVTPAAGTGAVFGSTGAILTTSGGGTTIVPRVTPAAPEEPVQEPTDPATAEPADATREEELGILDRLEADAKALRAKLFGPGQQ